MKPVKVHQPVYSVTVYKAVQRTTVDGATPTSARFSGTERLIDLGPWLSDSSSITTQKNRTSPAGGFSITVPDRPRVEGLGIESLYGLIEPMDLVTIRMRHAADIFGATQPPIVMRGFVSEVSRSESIGNDGKPQRTVTISGQDYGKIWQMIQIFYGPNYIIGEDILSTFKLLDRFGGGFANAISNKDFVTLAVDKIINPFLKRLLPEGSGFPLITVHTDNVVEGATGITGIQTQEGSIYQLLKNYMDIGAFNELFLADDDFGVRCIYRQNPVLTANGNAMFPLITSNPLLNPVVDDASVLACVEILDEEVLAMNVSRTDANVANYYWVNGPLGLNTDVYARQYGFSSAEQASINQSEYPNSYAHLYGTRMMNLTTTLGGAAIKNVKSGVTETEHEARDVTLADWMRNRREFLVAQNKDNSILESGTLRVMGNERVRAGNYIRVIRGNFAAMYYVDGVTHQILPFRGVYTTLTVSRGTGFVERIKLNGGTASPYLAELVETSSKAGT